MASPGISGQNAVVNTTMPSPGIPWVDASGRPTPAFAQFMTALASGNFSNILPSATDDASAAKAGVQVGGAYINGGSLAIRQK